MARARGARALYADRNVSGHGATVALDGVSVALGVLSAWWAGGGADPRRVAPAHRLLPAARPRRPRDGGHRLRAGGAPALVRRHGRAARRRRRRRRPRLRARRGQRPLRRRDRASDACTGGSAACQANTAVSSDSPTLWRTAHEIAHNLGAEHTEDRGGLMAYTGEKALVDNDDVCTTIADVRGGADDCFVAVDRRVRQRRRRGGRGLRRRRRRRRRRLRRGVRRRVRLGVRGAARPGGVGRRPRERVRAVLRQRRRRRRVRRGVRRAGRGVLQRRLHARRGRRVLRRRVPPPTAPPTCRRRRRAAAAAAAASAASAGWPSPSASGTRSTWPSTRRRARRPPSSRACRAAAGASTQRRLLLGRGPRTSRAPTHGSRTPTASRAQPADGAAGGCRPACACRSPSAATAYRRARRPMRRPEGGRRAARSNGCAASPPAPRARASAARRRRARRDRHRRRRLRRARRLRSYGGACVEGPDAPIWLNGVTETMPGGAVTVLALNTTLCPPRGRRLPPQAPRPRRRRVLRREPRPR